MIYLTEIFGALTSAASLWMLLWLFLSALIGFLTAYFYRQNEQNDLINQVNHSEREAAELRIRNTELLMNQEEVRKEIEEARKDKTSMESANKILSREKGQLYADVTLAKKQLTELQNKVEESPKKKEIKIAKEDIPEISLDNVMKASASLSGISAPIIEDAQSALDHKKSSSVSQKDAAAYIKEALGTRIKPALSKHKDNLQMIKGVGPFIEGKLNRLGIYKFEQISQLDGELIDKLTDAIQFFPGRIKRDDWVGQAKSLMK